MFRTIRPNRRACCFTNSRKFEPVLNDKQTGHIRHMRNLMAQPDGDWSHMDSTEAGQEGLSSYRYQLGHIVYALGLAHYHHLPAAP